jgi:hypothetical protein
MENDRSNAADEGLDVRLSWPSDPRRDELATPPSEREPEEVPEVHAGELVAGAQVGRPGTSLIDAYDRLGDRVLERMRALREDVDADLSAVRSELASLRQAVDDVGDRVQLRQLRATIDELRADVAGLRRAVLEWPELEQVSSDIGGLRGDMSTILEVLRTGGAPPAVDLPALAPLVEEVASLRSEVSALRRRIALRADMQAGGADEAELDRLAAQVAERIGATGKPSSRSRRR